MIRSSLPGKLRRSRRCVRLERLQRPKRSDPSHHLLRPHTRPGRPPCLQHQRWPQHHPHRRPDQLPRPRQDGMETRHWCRMLKRWAKKCALSMTFAILNNCSSNDQYNDILALTPVSGLVILNPACFSQIRTNCGTGYHVIFLTFDVSVPAHLLKIMIPCRLLFGHYFCLNGPKNSLFKWPSSELWRHGWTAYSWSIWVWGLFNNFVEQMFHWGETLTSCHLKDLYDTTMLLITSCNQMQ